MELGERRADADTTAVDNDHYDSSADDVHDSSADDHHDSSAHDVYNDEHDDADPGERGRRTVHGCERKQMGGRLRLDQQVSITWSAGDLEHQRAAALPGGAMERPDTRLQLPGSSGTRTVTLKFSETYFTSPNQRVFSVWINGQAVLSNFDIVAQGGRNAAVDRTFQVQSSGQISIHMQSTIDDPVISAIEIE